MIDRCGKKHDPAESDSPHYSYGYSSSQLNDVFTARHDGWLLRSHMVPKL